jgi:hypothetical protein
MRHFQIARGQSHRKLRENAAGGDTAIAGMTATAILIRTN